MRFRNAVRRSLVSLAIAAGATAALVAPANAGMGGCNRDVCITILGNGLRVDSVTARLAHGVSFTGHFHIWGGGIDFTTHTQNWNGSNASYRLNVGRDLPNGSVVCVEGWSGGRSLGRPCGEIKF
ncbi:hypothetical protein [Allokutzneria oryzae]|uniref:Secreted protein n=1 Tax=Allokutzneria oryzae TaxID=1378989 RepID=A0ABV5ZZZ5_9PSEU